MFKNTITKEELTQLPKENFGGKIVIVNTEEQMHAAISSLQKEKMIGFDTETKPSFIKGASSNKVALMQLSSKSKCYLFRLNKLGFPTELVQLISNPSITKIGISLKDDFHMLRKRFDIKPEGFVDLQSIVAEYGIEDKSLQKVYAILFEKRISKSQRLSNWEADELTDAQQEYAAIDAWACLEIYKILIKSEKVSQPKKKVSKTKTQDS